MHVLLVNDDGIHAQGLLEMCAALQAAGKRVSICAPDRERSANSHAITLRTPLFAKRVEIPGVEHAYAVNGTPADCARMGLFLIPDVDVVLSGINDGPNLGGACIYSGTVAGAIEASMSGVPALAVSSCEKHCTDYATAAYVALRVLDWMVEHPLPRGAIYNLNVPVVPLSQLKGICAASMAPIYLDSAVYRVEETEEGTAYYYTPGENVPIEDPECDLLRTEAGYATLTKLSWNLKLNAPDPDVSGICL